MIRDKTVFEAIYSLSVSIAKLSNAMLALAKRVEALEKQNATPSE